MKDLLHAMNVIGDEEENNWDVDDQYEVLKQRATSPSSDTLSQAITKQIENPEENDKQTKSESTFDAESFFAIGKPMPDPTQNPFSSENLKSIEEKLRKKEVTEGEAQTVPTIMLNSVSDEELERFRQVSSTEVEEQQNESKPFEIVSEPSQSTVLIQVDTKEEDERKPVVNGDEVKNLIDNESNQTQSQQQQRGTQQDHLEKLASVAEVKDPNEIAEMVNPNKTNITTVESSNDSIIIVDEDEISEEDEFILNQQDVRSYVSEISSLNETTTSSEQSNNSIIVVEEEEEPVPTQYHTQYQHTSMTYEHTSLTEPKIPLYTSKFGLKYRSTEQMINNGYILDLADFEDKKKLNGDVYIARVSLATYGQHNAKRVDYEFLLMNKARVRGAQFNVPPTITQEDLNQLVGQVVTIGGKWNLYNGNKQINVDTMEISSRTSPELFKSTESNKLDSWLELFINELKTDWIRELVISIYYGDGLLDRIKKTPAALSNHDTGEDGLFLHKMKVTMNAYQACKIYPTVNSEVVIASSLLHDIGKIWEIGENNYTEFGIAIGHITIGYSIVRDRLTELMKRGYTIDNRIANNILHCILAHHGKLEYGSPVEPKTREAWILHFCDSMDTFVTHIDEQLVGEKQAFSRMTKGSILDLN